MNSEVAGWILTVFPVKIKKGYSHVQEPFKLKLNHFLKTTTVRESNTIIASHSNMVTEKVGGKIGYVLGISSAFMIKSEKYVRFSGGECVVEKRV